MNLLLSMVTDSRIHHRSPADVVGVATPRHFLPGVYEHADSHGDVILTVVSPTGDGHVYGFALRMHGESIEAYRLPSCVVQPAIDWLWRSNSPTDLTERPEVVKQLLKIAASVAVEYPSQLWEDGDE